MTDSQVKYQTLMEDQRHNLAMEKLGQQELRVKQGELKVKEESQALAVAKQNWTEWWEPYKQANEITYKAVTRDMWQNFRDTAAGVKDVFSIIFGGPMGIMGSLIG